LTVAATLLLSAGVAKLARPQATAMALQLAGVHAGPRLVRAGALGEAALGAGALVVGGRAWAIALGLSYAALATFVALALARSLPLATCACFGEDDTPPSRLHLIIDGAAVAAAFGAALHQPARSPLVTVVRQHPTTGTAQALAVAVVAYLAYLTMTALPRVTAARSRVR
jgi:hypothetical protein